MARNHFDQTNKENSVSRTRELYLSYYTNALFKKFHPVLAHRLNSARAIPKNEAQPILRNDERNLQFKDQAKPKSKGEIGRILGVMLFYFFRCL